MLLFVLCVLCVVLIFSIMNVLLLNVVVVEVSRVDISVKINDSFLSNMNDFNWKICVVVLEEFGNILRGVNNCIILIGGDLFKVFNVWFVDFNRMFVVTAFNIVGEFVFVIGLFIDKVG